jgi:hypothetical protein
MKKILYLAVITIGSLGSLCCAMNNDWIRQANEQQQRWMREQAERTRQEQQRQAQIQRDIEARNRQQAEYRRLYGPK